MCSYSRIIFRRQYDKSDLYVAANNEKTGRLLVKQRSPFAWAECKYGYNRRRTNPPHQPPQAAVSGVFGSFPPKSILALTLPCDNATTLRVAIVLQQSHDICASCRPAVGMAFASMTERSALYVPRPIYQSQHGFGYGKLLFVTDPSV
jgi:hypothetical protein